MQADRGNPRIIKGRVRHNNRVKKHMLGEALTVFERLTVQEARRGICQLLYARYGKEVANEFYSVLYYHVNCTDNGDKRFILNRPTGAYLRHTFLNPKQRRTKILIELLEHYDTYWTDEENREYNA